MTRKTTYNAASEKRTKHRSEPTVHPGAALVGIARCKKYDYATVERTLQRILTPLGGLEHFVSRGSVVFLKPNLLSAKPPGRAITTHPIIVEVLANYIKDLGAKVQIGDSPAGAVRGLQRYWDNCGITEVAERTGAKIVAFETGGVVHKRVKERDYYLAKDVLEADIVINLPKIKTHGLTLFTGAIKNLFGTIPGLRKSEYHKLAPHPEDFASVLVDIFSLVDVDLHIADAIIGMEGNGPSSGIVREMGFLAASTDGVALDAVAASIMGFGEKEIDTTVQAAQRGLGVADLEHIRVHGPQPSELKIEQFQLPSNRVIKLVPRWLMFLVAKLIWIRPKPIEERCKRCGACTENCPVAAIHEEDGFPVVDYDKCIRCLCCDEGCPHNAIEQEMSWLAKKLS